MAGRAVCAVQGSISAHCPVLLAVWSQPGAFYLLGKLCLLSSVVDCKLLCLIHSSCPDLQQPGRVHGTLCSPSPCSLCRIAHVLNLHAFPHFQSVVKLLLSSVHARFTTALPWLHIWGFWMDWKGWECLQTSPGGSDVPAAKQSICFTALQTLDS